MSFKPLENEPELSGGEDVAEALNDGGEANFVAGDTKPAVSRQTILVAGMLLACAAGAYVLKLRSGPATASAADTTAATTINEFLSNGEEHVQLMKQMLQNTEKVVQRFRSYPTKTQVPLAKLHKNPFRQLAAATNNAAPTDAAAKKRQAQEREAVLKAVESLGLQSVLHSESHKACMINSTLYQEGQQVDGFVIEKIVASSVIVRKGNYRFELKMQK
jgi:hypothetical protein